jgi:hypothetical protein
LGGVDLGRRLLLRREQIPRLDFLPDRHNNAQAGKHGCQELLPYPFDLYHWGDAIAVHS